MRKSPPAMLSQRQSYALTVSAVLVSLPFVQHQSAAISAICAALLFWYGLNSWRSHARPPVALLMFLGVVGAIVIGVSLGQIFGKLPGLAMLMLFLPLKLLESRNVRDGRAALMLCCFLLMGIFLHEQSMLTAVLSTLALLSILISFALLQHDAPLQLAKLQGSRSLITQGVPLLILFFVFFPRINGPLWGLPLDTSSGQTGLSDRMQPGSISDLIQNGSIAFRATFRADPPPPAERYWRGPVLSAFDGKEWSNLDRPSADQADYQVTGPAYDYDITLEPHNKTWLLALDYLADSPQRGRIRADYSLVSARPVRDRQRYELRSYPATPLNQHISEYELEFNLRIPAGSNPRIQALGAELRQQATSNTARADLIIAYMRKAGLRYTLTPPLLGQHSADEFLFDSREGFCEHFSSSFTLLARAAGIPARVVIGYQGGEINSIDRSIVVRQSDAHAWAEVWLGERGWVRFDPTAASYPERIEDNLNAALGDISALPFMLRNDFSWLRGLRHRWEAINNTWNQWVLGYDANRQLELMRKLGLRDIDWRSLTAATVGIGAIWVLWLLAQYWPRRVRRDALDQQWHRLCKKLAARGLPRHSWESPSHYAQRITQTKPELIALLAIAERYAQLRFGPRPATDADIMKMKRAIKKVFQQ